MNPLDVECIHPYCNAQKGEACTEFDIEDPKHPTPFLIAGAPGFHSERYVSLAMNSGGTPVTKEEFAKALEGLI